MSEDDPALADDLRRVVRDVPDYPKAGIVFKDITPVLGSGRLFARACEAMARPYEGMGVSHVVAIESRGFLFGGVVAHLLGAGLVPVRKVGKLPYKTERVEYALEYGTDSLEMHVDALPATSRALIIDDLLATGGTAAAAISLVNRVGARAVGTSFLIRLAFLGGERKIEGTPVASILTY